MSLAWVGVCNEVQLELNGDGNWTLYEVKVTAFERQPLVSI